MSEISESFVAKTIDFNENDWKFKELDRKVEDEIVEMRKKLVERKLTKNGKS